MTALSASKQRAVMSLLIGALLFVAPAAGAQTVGGRVLDSATHMPARGLDIRLVGDSDQVLATTTSDSTGLFYMILAQPERARIQFSLGGRLAFETRTMSLAADDFVERNFLISLPRVGFGARTDAYKPPAARRATLQLDYPRELSAERAEGNVVASFDVDTSGRADMATFRVLSASDTRFIAAVRDALWSARFVPAEDDGHKVRQTVEQAFDFSLGTSASRNLSPTPSTRDPVALPRRQRGVPL